jgi:hypothetical protein
LCRVLRAMVIFWACVARLSGGKMRWRRIDLQQTQHGSAAGRPHDPLAPTPRKFALSANSCWRLLTSMI